MADDDAWCSIPVSLPAPGGSQRFDVGEHALLLCNAGGTPYVVQERCPHARFSLEGGAINGTILSCPFHGGQLDLRDGSPAGMPIRKAARCFAVRDADDGGLEVAIPARSRPGEAPA